MTSDAELLRRYAAERAESAFAELVRRHIDLVYSVALRQVGNDAQLAEDVAQQVFTALARKAAAVAKRPSVSGWLYRSTHYAASDVVRAERRRRARETEAQMIQEIHGSPGTEPEWEKARPVIDAVIAELDERDRDAVALRFFDRCSFAEVGARLRLTENAARMRVERALDKLHAALARRGVTSTAAALGVALANQVTAAAPAPLATAVAGAAIAAVGDTSAATAGVLAFSGATNAVAIASAVVAVVAGVAAFLQHGRRADAEAARAAAEQQVRALRVEANAFAGQLRQAEQRAAEAEKDSGELLKAVAALKSAEAKRATDTHNAARAAAADPAEPAASQRAYQQALARRRADEAKERARLQSAAVIDPEPRRLDASARRIDVNKMLDAAAALYAQGDFQGARQTLNLAVTDKPADVPLPARAGEVRRLLEAQNMPVTVSVVSDGETWVMILGALQPAKLQASTLSLAPGNYEVIGRRTGFRDVAFLLKVRAGEAPPPVRVVCTVRVGP